MAYYAPRLKNWGTCPQGPPPHCAHGWSTVKVFCSSLRWLCANTYYVMLYDAPVLCSCVVRLWFWYGPRVCGKQKQKICLYDTDTAEELGSLLSHHTVRNFWSTHVHSFSCRCRLGNLRGDCSWPLLRNYKMPTNLQRLTSIQGVTHFA